MLSWLRAVACGANPRAQAHSSLPARKLGLEHGRVPGLDPQPVCPTTECEAKKLARLSRGQRHRQSSVLAWAAVRVFPGGFSKPHFACAAAAAAQEAMRQWQHQRLHPQVPATVPVGGLGTSGAAAAVSISPATRARGVGGLSSR
jgi:hypothetical protein